jgi:hypothetical protein
MIFLLYYFEEVCINIYMVYSNVTPVPHIRASHHSHRAKDDIETNRFLLNIADAGLVMGFLNNVLKMSIWFALSYKNVNKFAKSNLPTSARRRADTCKKRKVNKALNTTNGRITI